MKQNKIHHYIAAVLTVLVLLTGVLPPVPAEAATGMLTNITAVYTGSAAVVGEEISTEDVYVTGYYVSGGKMSTAQIKDGFLITPATVQSEGENKMTVHYQEYTAEFSVTGKKVLYIEAEYTSDDEVTVGSEIPKKYLKVTAYYTDGSKAEISDYTLPVTKVYQKGINTFSVLYGSHVATFYVSGKEALAIEQLIAYYYGDEAIVGNELDKTNVEVMALYNDGRIETVKNFTLSPSAPSKEGLNNIVVTYGGASVTIEVYAREKIIESIEAQYIGQGVIVGRIVDANDIEVTATYEDGTKGRVTAFELSGSLINYEGDNIVLVYCDYFIKEVVVPGVKNFEITYDYSISQVLYDGSYELTTVTLAMNKDMAEDSFLISQLDADVIEQAVQRVVPTEEFIGFTITYDEDDLIKEFPMAMKVTVPSGYDSEQFGVYYTPNQRTIMAKLNGEFLDEEKTEYQFIVNKPGTYVLVHEVSNLLVTDIEIEKEMTLKAGRTYFLTPVVLPVNAENKNLSYWSSDEDIATVSENGKLCTYREGTCDIWIEALDESGAWAIVTLHVKKR
ncbi:MAG: Ig-like domain-containing protein [Lachnospiraceae bacterium]